MQTSKHAINMSKITLGVGALVLAVSAAHASTNNLELKIGAISCGMATLQVLDIKNNVIQLGSFLGNGNCGEFGEGNGDGGPGQVDPNPDPDPDPDPGPTGTPVTGGIESFGWNGRAFPAVKQTQESIGANKYVYYKINTADFKQKEYSGLINSMATTSSGHAQYSMWISSSPGGASIGNNCISPMGAEGMIRWSTNYPKAKAYNCKLTKPGTYYINVTDRTYERFMAGKSGTCSLARGCPFALGVSGTER